MAIDVLMPQMGESIVEGTITKWLKQAGDAVEKDEPLFEISTDKVDAEIPAPAAGVLSEIRIAEGVTVQVNTVVAILLEREEAAAAARAEAVKDSRPAVVDAAPPMTGGTEVVMPQMGESIVEGTITKWLKEVGDTVEHDEPLFEISTDKVDAEIPAPVGGVLTQILAGAGETVQVNTVVAVIGGALATPGVRAQTIQAEPVAAEAPLPPAPPVRQPAAAPMEGKRLRSSPLVRRIAREKKVDLAQVTGTGAAGRITKEDILLHLSTPRNQLAAAATTATAQAAARTVSATPQAMALRGQAVPMTKMRAIIAQRMVESRRISPHVHTVYKVDMTRIVRLRERLKSRFEQTHGVKLTYMPFIASAVVEALCKFPVLNASLIDGAIHYHRNVHLGIAVALDWGLIVPVVKQAEERSFLGLSRSIADLVERARAKKLLPDEASGSTFTLTNSGVFGGLYGTPIINQPESAILAIGGLQKEAVVLTDAEGNDSIAIRSMQHFCLGFDHRIIDGADSGKFMAALKSILEGWEREIL
jgi:2-oxoglutarate dehydrogenase E2 component (dihydrolipoamide succinyltransferase)